jgi:hypothetical protein
MKFLPGQSGNPAGRKPKTVALSKLPLISKLAARGVREKDIARHVADMSEATWIAYKRDHPEVVAAVDAGRQVMHDALIGKMFESAMSGDQRAGEFILRAVFGYRDQGDPPGEVRPQVIINLPGAATLDQYRPALIAERAERSDG